MTGSLEPPGFSNDPPAAQGWRWRLENAAGVEVEVPGVGQPRFPSQSDAESWVGETWAVLLEEGVEAVTLFEGDRQVYGPMSLRAES